MPRYEYWREIATGDVWAVKLEDDAVVAAAGPLHWSEMKAAHLHAHDYTPAHAARLALTRAEFEPIDERALLLFSAGAD
jgi:hypothetical protein